MFFILIVLARTELIPFCILCMHFKGFINVLDMYTMSLLEMI